VIFQLLGPEKGKNFMSDAKPSYHHSVVINKILSFFSSALKKTIESAKWRKSKYGPNWQSVNINDFVAKFTPNPIKTHEGNKMHFTSRDGKYRITADKAGGYCRLEDFTKYNPVKRQHFYLDINGNDARNYTDARGKQHGRSPGDFNAVTHFRIMHKWEM
jgi:hypothetical protein